ncbi:unnamed protein product, partial [Citrullus colocynthis]
LYKPGVRLIWTDDTDLTLFIICNTFPLEWYPPIIALSLVLLLSLVPTSFHVLICWSFLFGVFPERKQRWSKKLICSSRQYMWGESSLFKSRSKSGIRKFRASNSTAESYGGSAEISKGQPAPWLSTWPSKQVRTSKLQSPTSLHNFKRLFFPLASPLRFSDPNSFR